MLSLGCSHVTSSYLITQMGAFVCVNDPIGGGGYIRGVWSMFQIKCTLCNFVSGAKVQEQVWVLWEPSGTLTFSLFFYLLICDYAFDSVSDPYSRSMIDRAHHRPALKKCATG